VVWRWPTSRLPPSGRVTRAVVVGESAAARLEPDSVAPARWAPAAVATHRVLAVGGTTAEAPVSAPGEIVARDLNRAAYYDGRACSLGEMWGCFTLAESQEKGEGVAKDDASAFRLYSQVCTQSYLPRRASDRDHRAADHQGPLDANPVQPASLPQLQDSQLAPHLSGDAGSCRPHPPAGVCLGCLNLRFGELAPAGSSSLASQRRPELEP
jgi:hypothetical protein